MKIKKLVFLLLCLLILGNSLYVNEAWAGNDLTVNIASSLPAGSIKAAETSELALYYTPGDYRIMIADKRNGFVWSSAVLDYEGNSNDFIKSKISALFDFRYTNTTNKKYAIVSISFLDNKPDITMHPTPDGISLTYNFSKLGFTIPVDISIKDNSLTAKIPAEKIKEEKEFHLISIDLLPFLGASKNTEQGYMFYPDGSGALFRFKNEPRQDIGRSSFYVYGTDALDMRTLEENEENDIKTAMLPVFGVKKGNNAFVSVITKGEFDAAVNFTPSGFSNIGVNRISAEFTCRRTFEDLRNDPNIPPRIENDIIVADREVRYLFLVDDKANYSGMANEYRDYLIEKGDLVRKNGSNSDMPFGLDIFMGIKEKRILFDKFVKATTFNQAGEIIRSLTDKGAKNLQVKLIGWGEQGYGAYPTLTGPGKKLGGSSDLKELTAFIREKGFQLYLDANVTDALKESGGFSIRNDTVYSKNGLVISDRGNNRFLMNPIAALQKLKTSLAKQFKGDGINGLVFEKIGSHLFYDFNRKNPSSRQQTAGNWQEILNLTKAQTGSAGINGGNAYLLKNVDRLFEIPVEDSGNIYTTEAIPFYQMVVHGYIPYSSTPGNLFYDYADQKLKWIEYGCIPYFKLTYQEADVLKYTEYNSLFSSGYKSWSDIAADTYNEFNTRLGSVWTKVMLSHEQVLKDVYKVVYEDGTSVYINYRTTDAVVEGKVIKATDYLVVDKGGNTR